MRDDHRYRICLLVIVGEGHERPQYFPLATVNPNDHLSISLPRKGIAFSPSDCTGTKRGLYFGCSDIEAEVRPFGKTHRSPRRRITEHFVTSSRSDVQRTGLRMYCRRIAAPGVSADVHRTSIRCCWNPLSSVL